MAMGDKQDCEDLLGMMAILHADNAALKACAKSARVFAHLAAVEYRLDALPRPEVLGPRHA